MRRELEPRFYGNGEKIICVHCGLGREETESRMTVNGGVYSYRSCDCPGHLKTIIVGFDEMPNLPERVANFETYLELEECQKNGDCTFMSVTKRMCPACRLRLVFHHTVYIHHDS